MRYSLNFSSDFGCELPYFLQSALMFGIGIRGALLKYVELDAQHCDALIDIVMKLSRDACTFLLLRIDQPAAHAGKSFLGLLTIRNVHAGAYITCERTIRVKS